MANQPPSFTKGPDEILLRGVTARNAAGWATNISPGALESGQSVTFIVTNDNNALFTVQPAISSAGTLTYAFDPAMNGTAIVTVTLQDNGGTLDGGSDTSAPQTFEIKVPVTGATGPLNSEPGPHNLIGGGVDNTYVIDHAQNVVVEFAGGGTDLVTASISYVLALDVENLTLSGTADVNGTGNIFANQITGNSGVNMLDGLGGADTLTGLGGSDWYFVDNAGDVIVDGVGQGEVDRVLTSVSYVLTQGAEIEIISTTNYRLDPINLTGNEQPNALVGNEGDNRLDGGEGRDLMIGGPGNDFYFADHADDNIIEGAGEGILDYVYATVSYALPAEAQIERMKTGLDEGTQRINLTGNRFQNMLVGNDGDNIIDGGEGRDEMVGGLGNDWFFVDDAGDQLSDAGGSADRVYTSVSYRLGSGIEIFKTRLDEGTTPLNLTGNTLGNHIVGNYGDNLLDGGEGRDTLVGALGNDWYFVDHASDVVIETAGEGSADRVYASVSYSLAAGAEIELMKTTYDEGTAALNLGGNEVANLIIGNGGNNTLDGRGGNDALRGGAGADRFLFSTPLDAATNVDSIEGFATADDLVVLEDVIFTGLAPGALPAGSYTNAGVPLDGNDRIIYNQVTGAVSFDPDGTGANSTIQFATLSAGLALTIDHFLVITGGAGVLANQPPTFTKGPDEILLKGVVARNASGWATNISGPESGQNVNFIVTNDNNALFTQQPAISPTGTLTYTLDPAMNGTAVVAVMLRDNGGTANGGDDTSDPQIFEIKVPVTGATGPLNSEPGPHNLIGGGVDNTYVIGHAQNTVIELAGAGTDLVTSSLTFVLLPDIENLTLSGTADRNGTGNVLDNDITGNSGDNRLDGGEGRDLMIGGPGNDFYFADHADDNIIEGAGEGTYDHVFATVSYALPAEAHIERLKTGLDEGTKPINLTGNRLQNMLIGNDGDNTLDGGEGRDSLVGGLGNDWFFVDNVGDEVLDTGGSGDRAYTSVSYTLAAGVEIEIMKTTNDEGTNALNLSGNEFANFIVGNDGNNTLDGRGGNDGLRGGGGPDRFQFTTPLDAATNIDTVEDFVTAPPGVSDLLVLEDVIFTGLAPGALPAGSYTNAGVPLDGDDRLIYNPVTGALSFDPDGTGVDPTIQFAILSAGLALTSDHFLVV